MAPLGLSSDARRNPQGVPVLGYPHAAGRPQVAVERWAGGHPPRAVAAGTHAHDFLVLFYVERGTGLFRADDRDWPLGPGDAFVVAPGTVVAPHRHPIPSDVVSWTVQFPADAIDPAAPAPLASWRAHPLLAPFLGPFTRPAGDGEPRRGSGGAQRLHVPAADRERFLGHLRDLDAELRHRRDGFADAARAHLTLVLVQLSRLRVDWPEALAAEPLLAAAFDVIESRFHEPITARDVAAAVGRTAGHVTTVVTERTGRSVGQWLTERRLREARRLLVGTDLTVAEVGHRVGYRDAGYFARRFRTAHGVPPEAWRQAGR